MQKSASCGILKSAYLLIFTAGRRRFQSLNACHANTIFRGEFYLVICAIYGLLAVFLYVITDINFTCPFLRICSTLLKHTKLCETFGSRTVFKVRMQHTLMAVGKIRDVVYMRLHRREKKATFVCVCVCGCVCGDFCFFAIVRSANCGKPCFVVSLSFFPLPALLKDVLQKS